MIGPLAVLLALATARAEPWRSPYPEPIPAASTSYPGTFDRAPVPHFAIPMPGGAAAKAERARPLIVGSTVLVGSASGEALYQLDRGNGSLVRTFPAAAPVQAEPLVIGDRVFFGDVGGTIWSYKLTGEKVWSYDTAAPVLVRPTLANGRIFVTNVDDLTVALDAVEGTMVWRHKQRSLGARTAELSLYAAPPAVVVGDTVYAGYHDGTLVALSAEHGDERWKMSVGEGRYPDLVAPPTAWEGLLFVSGYYAPLLAVDAATHRVVWTLPHGSADAAVVLEQPDGALLLHPGSDGKLRAIRPRTGEIVWTWESPDTAALLTPVPTPLGVLVGCTGGTLWALDPATGEPSWVFAPPYILEGLSAAPAVEGRQVVFATNGGRLYSLLAPGGPRHAAKAAPAKAKPAKATASDTPRVRRP